MRFRSYPIMQVHIELKALLVLLPALFFMTSCATVQDSKKISQEDIPNAVSSKKAESPAVINSQQTDLKQ